MAGSQSWLHPEIFGILSRRRLRSRARSLRGAGESYRSARDGVPVFPSLEPVWVGALVGFYFKASHTITETNRAKLMSLLDALLAGPRWKNPVEPLLSYRMF